MDNVSIRKIDSPKEIEEALSISLDVFTKCNSEDYSEEGYSTFYSFVNDPMQVSAMIMYGAFIGDRLVGVIGFKEGGRHLSLFFILKEYQGEKIGKKLFLFARKDTGVDTILVKASTYAVDIYKSLGFKVVDNRCSARGLVFTMMKFSCRD